MEERRCKCLRHGQKEEWRKEGEKRKLPDTSGGGAQRLWYLKESHICLLTHEFINPFNKFSLSLFHVPDIVLGDSEAQR